MCDGGRLNSHVRPKRNGRTFPPLAAKDRGWGEGGDGCTADGLPTPRLAKEASAEEARVYAFTACSQPVKLSQQRLLAAWGSQDKLNQQTQKCENGCREFEWPSTGIHDTHGMT